LALTGGITARFSRLPFSFSPDFLQICGKNQLK
jgi:hypothetical protein